MPCLYQVIDMGLTVGVDLRDVYVAVLMRESLDECNTQQPKAGSLMFHT